MNALHFFFLFLFLVNNPSYGLDTPPLSAVGLNGLSFFSPRSQSTDAARRLAGIHTHLYECDTRSFFSLLTITPIYTRSSWPRHIAETLFGHEQVAVTGSYDSFSATNTIQERTTHDIFADYFGLSPDFKSSVFLNPRLQNALVEGDLYLGLDCIYPGVYFRAILPVGWTEWRLGINEFIGYNSQNTPFPAGYQSEGPDDLPVNVFCFTQAVLGHKSFGANSTGLEHDLFGSTHTLTGCSDLYMQFGWNIILESDKHVGINVQGAAPTGSRPKGIYLFEPILGNGKHWELGFGVSGHSTIWEEPMNQSMAIFLDLNFTHIFKARQHRTFDLTEPNGFGSRYILMKVFEDGTFNGNVIPVGNVTRLACNVHCDAQFDGVVMLAYTYKNFLFDIGYDGWIRTRELISLQDCIEENTYGLKGIQNVYDELTSTFDQKTESIATLEEVPINPDDPNAAKIARADLVPRFISLSNVNPFSAASPMILTHKIFAYLGYDNHINQDCPYAIFFGVGAEVEFEGINTHLTAVPNRQTLSQWIVWARGGIDF